MRDHDCEVWMEWESNKRDILIKGAIMELGRNMVPGKLVMPELINSGVIAREPSWDLPRPSACG